MIMKTEIETLQKGTEKERLEKNKVSVNYETVLNSLIYM